MYFRNTRLPAAWFCSLLLFGFLPIISSQEIPVPIDLASDRILDLEILPKKLGMVKLRDFNIAANGHVYLIDEGESRIVHLDDKFQAMGSFGRAGQGPGEFNSPFQVLPKDNELYVVGAFSPIQVFSKQGQYLRQYKLDPGEMPQFIYFQKNGDVITTLSSWKNEGDAMRQIRELVRFDKTFKQKKVLYSRSAKFNDHTPQEEARLLFYGYAADSAGSFYIMNRNTQRYDLQKYHPDGKPALTMTRPFQPVPKTSQEIKAQEDRMKQSLARIGAGDRVKMSKVDPYRQAISQILMDDRDELWAVTIGPSAGDNRTYLDHFSRDGHFLQQYRLPEYESPLVVVRRDAVWIVDANAEEGLELIRFPLQKSKQNRSHP